MISHIGYGKFLSSPNQQAPPCLEHSNGQPELNPAPVSPPPGFMIPFSVTAALLIIISVATMLADAFPARQAPFGADWGVWTLGGEWWRLLTSNFVHHTLFHLLGNLFFLWVFGKRLERILGKWTFLLFYLICGLAGSIVSLAAHPEAGGYGASGGVAGLAGGLISAYGLKIKTLSKRQWWKFALLVLWIAWVIYGGLGSQEIDNAAHIGGLIMGLVLGAALTYGHGQTTHRRRWIFAAAALALVLGAISVRQAHGYVVHLSYAVRALERGQMDEASRQLHIALQMKPESRVAHFLARQLEDHRHQDGCVGLRYDPRKFALNPDLCKGRICDGQVHTANGPDGTRISYRGTIQSQDGKGASEIATTTTLTMQILDEFSDIACTTVNTSVTKQRINARGLTKGPAHLALTSQSTLSDDDPEARSMRDQTLHAKP
jgi:membrane associated rhomboid family serine protease